MEALLGFPLSLAFALIPVYAYKASFHKPFWLVGVLLTTGVFLFLPDKMRLEAFLPGGAAIFYLMAGFWVMVLNPQSAVFKLLSMPLPTRKELKAEIEKETEIEARLAKYQKFSLQLKKIWFKRDQFLTGFNSAFLLFFTALASVVSLSVAAYEYFVAGTLKILLEEIQKQVAANMQKAGVEVVDFRPELLASSPIIIVASSFLAVLCLGVFLRIFVRARFKVNMTQGYLSLFRLPDSWVWGLILCAGVFFLSLRLPELESLAFFMRNAMFILLFLYMLQGIGIASLFFEVRLVPTLWVALGLMLLGLWLPPFITLLGVSFTLMGLAEVWFSLRKRCLRPVTDSD